MRMWRWGWVSIGLVLVTGIVGFATIHPMYYDCEFGRDTILVVSNLTPSSSEEGYRLRLYDCAGVLVHDVVGALKAYGSAALQLGDLLAEYGDGCYFGLATVESALLIKVGAWCKEDGVWVSVDSGGTWYAGAIAADYAALWYNLQFADTRNRSSAFMLVNPGEEIAAVTGYLYDSSGRLLERRDFRVRPHETDYYIPEELDYAPQQAAVGGWGTLDIRSTKPLILVGEYYDVDQWLIDLDIVREAYYVESKADQVSR